MTEAPKGRGVIWMRRIANIGFGIAAVYFVYLVAILVVSANMNSGFEGEALGPISIENVTDGVTPPIADQTQLLKSDLLASAAPTKRAVILWATWCGPCHSLLMDLKSEITAGKLKPENLIAVSMAEPLKDVSAYLTETPLPFRVALDREGNLARRVKLQGTPTVMFLNEKGIIEKVSTGGFGLSGKIIDFVK